jgi:hypothetical protein
MKPSEQAKAAGLDSLAQVTELTGVPNRTLIDWAKTKPELFNVILKGCTLKAGKYKPALENLNNLLG